MSTNNEFDYYIIGSTYPESVPLLMVDDEVNPAGISFLSRSETVADNYVAHICFGDPIPAKPRLVDYLSLDGTRSVFSKKIYDILKNHDIKGLQLVPAIIRGKSNDEYKDFWIANIYQRFLSFDKETSKFRRISRQGDIWMGIEKVVLKKELLSTVKLEDRLVFVAKENPAFVIYHKTIVDIIMNVNPEGVCFTPIDTWHEGIQFDK